jgi:aspartate/methionine/tyrosine aminotransferase
VQKYLIEAAQERWFSYGGADAEFLDAICNWEKKFCGLDFTPADIVATPGCGAAWNIVHRMLLDPGDDIVAILPAHFNSSDSRQARMIGCNIIPSMCIEEENWEPDIDDLRQKVTDKTKYIALDHPNNPTGQIYSDKALNAIIDIAGEHDIPVMSDEMYLHITYHGEEPKSLALYSTDVPVVVFRSFSKEFMSPGARVAWFGIHDPAGKFTEAKAALKHHGNAHVAIGAIPLPMRVAATRVLKACMEQPKYQADTQGFPNPWVELKSLRFQLQEWLDYADKRIAEIEGLSWVKPKATLYGSPKIDGIGTVWKDDDDWLFGLMREEHVAFNKAARFACPEHFRTLLMAHPPEDIWNRVERFMKRHYK